MAELGQTNDPKALIPGVASTLNSTALELRNYGDLLALAGQGLQRIDTSEGWTGAAADAFRDVFHGQPAKWIQAGDAFHEAATALYSYADALEWAQGQAGDAIDLWAAGTPHHQAAQSLLAAARSSLASAGDTANTAVGKARDLAPPKPGLWSEVTSDVGSFLSGTGHFLENMGEGFVNDVASIGNAAVHDPGHVLEVPRRTEASASMLARQRPNNGMVIYWLRLRTSCAVISSRCRSRRYPSRRRSWDYTHMPTARSGLQRRRRWPTAKFIPCWPQSVLYSSKIDHVTKQRVHSGQREFPGRTS